MTTKNNNGKPNLSTAGSRVRLRLVNVDEMQEPRQTTDVVDQVEAAGTPPLKTKSTSPLVSFMTAYADAIDRQVAELTNGLV